MFHPTIIDLQYFQELHDKRYHLDIYSKPLMTRVAHLHQHLVKYSSSEVKRNQTYPDALACVLSIANAINLNISFGFLSIEQSVTNLDDIPQVYHDDYLVEQYRIELGKLAKQLEGFDHVEPLEYRKQIGASIVTVLSILVQLYRSDGPTGFVFESAYLKKLIEIKSKSIFFPHYHTADYSDPTYKSIYRFAELN